MTEIAAACPAAHRVQPHRDPARIDSSQVADRECRRQRSACDRGDRDQRRGLPREPFGGEAIGSSEEPGRGPDQGLPVEACSDQAGNEGLGGGYPGQNARERGIGELAARDEDYHCDGCLGEDARVGEPEPGVGAAGAADVEHGPHCEERTSDDRRDADDLVGAPVAPNGDQTI